MNITIAVNIEGNSICEATAQSLLALRDRDSIRFVFVTDKKRYELAEQLLELMHMLNAMIVTDIANTDGVVFTMASNEVLHELAVQYVRNYYQHADVGSKILDHIRSLFVTTVIEQKMNKVYVLCNEDRNYQVSCIIPVYNAEKYLREAVDSVISQTIGFEESVQLILINDGSIDSSGEICVEYLRKYPHNVIYVEQENQGVSAARNKGIDLASGMYTFFLDADDYIDTNLFETGIALLSKHGEEVDFVSFALSFFGNKTGRIHPLEYRFGETHVVNIGGSESNFIENRVASCFFDSRAIHAVRFNARLKYMESVCFVTQIIQRKNKYLICNDIHYYIRIVSEAANLFDNFDHYSDWYVEFFQVVSCFITDDLNRAGHVTKYMQQLIMYELQLLHLRAMSRHNMFQLDADNTVDMLKKLLNHIEDSVIREQRLFHHWQKLCLLEIKHGKSQVVDDGVPAFYIGGVRREQLLPPVHISIVEEYNGEIVIAGSYHSFDDKNIRLVAVYNDTFYPCIYYDTSYRGVYLFGSLWRKASVFEVRIPFSNDGRITFYAMVDGYGVLSTHLSFRVTSRMKRKIGSFVIGDKSILLRAGTDSFIATSVSKNAIESVIQYYVKNNFEEKKSKNEISLLQQYTKLYPLLSKKRIWIFMDRRERADDNAEHLFRYCSGISDGVDKYFVLDSDSPDVERIQKYGKVLYYGSDEHKLMHLFAECFISSQFTRKFLFPYGAGEHAELFMGLSKAKLIGLQHGIMLSDMSAQFSRWDTNAKLFVTSTKTEYDSILKYDYCYGKNIVKLTGLPRYDNLVNNPKKQILFMFTWRKSLAQTNLDSTGSIYLYNPDFKHSSYFKCIQSLLTDSRLLSVAHQMGFELVYRPHPNVYVQIEDFSFNEQVIISPADESYQKLFSEAAMAITDYTSAIFDFAYLKKPVFYYQFSENNWGDGYFDYETMGFGPIVTEHDKLVELLIHYMCNECEMQSVYKTRADEFFAFFDSCNCKRVYEEIISLEG